MIPESSRFPSRCWIQSVQEPGSGPKAVDRRLRSAVSGVSDERIVEPVTQVLERHASTRERLDVAVGRR